MAQDAIPDDEVQGAIADAPADGVAVVVLAVIPAAAAVLGAILAVSLEARVAILVWAEAVEILALAAALVEMRAGVEEWVSIQVAAPERVESLVAAVRVWMPASVVLDAPPVWAALDAFLVEVASGESLAALGLACRCLDVLCSVPDESHSQDARRWPAFRHSWDVCYWLVFRWWDAFRSRAAYCLPDVRRQRDENPAVARREFSCRH